MDGHTSSSSYLQLGWGRIPDSHQDIRTPAVCTRTNVLHGAAGMQEGVDIRAMHLQHAACIYDDETRSVSSIILYYTPSDTCVATYHNYYTMATCSGYIYHSVRGKWVNIHYY